MYIKQLNIQNIRAISDLEITFEQPAGWHVLIGDNGQGKSSIIRAIAAVLIGPEQIMAILPIWEEWLSKGKEEGSITLAITADKIDKSGGRPPKNTPIINKFSLIRQNQYRVLLSTNIDIPKMNPANFNWSNNVGWFSVAYGPFRRFTGGDNKWNKVYYSAEKAGAHLSVFGEDIALTEALDWLKELDRKRLKENEELGNNKLAEPSVQYNTQSDSIFQNLKTFINKSGLLSNSTYLDSIDIDGDVVFKDIKGNNIKVVQLSDGFRSILSLTFELIRQLVRTYGHKAVFENINKPKMEIPCVGVVLLDEIDAHLHPEWQNRIGKWFTQYFPNIQFIVTTHSPLICRACAKGSIWQLKDGAATQILGVAKERLVHGNILEATGTNLFGENMSVDEKTPELRNRLGELYEKSMMGLIENKEEPEFEYLKSIFPTFKPTFSK